MLKKVFIVFLSIIIMIGFLSVVYAGDNFDTSRFENHSGSAASESVKNMSGGILAVVRIAAVGIGLIMLTVLGMKYMLASPGDRAEIKGSAIRYILGAVIMFAAAALLSIIASFTETALPSN